MLEWCVTGMPRSGTMWAAEALSSVGLSTVHESACSGWLRDFDDDGMWRLARDGESSWQAAPFTRDMRAEGVKVIHLVRHPLDVAASMIANGMMGRDIVGLPYPFQQFITTYTSPTIWQMDRVNGALLFWILWNELVHADHVWTVPVTPAQVLAAFPILEAEAAGAMCRTEAVNGKATPVALTPADFNAGLWDRALSLWQSLSQDSPC